jgi:hypothetical protein
MLLLRTWPSTGAPADDGLVVVVLHPKKRATVLIVPRAARAEDVEEMDMGMPMALYRAQIEAARRGFSCIYVAANEEAPWDAAWGDLSD